MDKKRFLKISLAAVILFVLFILIFFAVKKMLKSDKPNDIFTVVETSVLFEEEQEAYVSPIDFKKLNDTNSDIYAWFEIPSLELSFPLLQNEDDEKYIRRDINGKYDMKGSLFTESAYNSKDFNDPVTIIYGHSMHDGTMFGGLQKAYSSSEGIEENKEIIIFLPDRELHYEVFAAVPYDNRHILYNYDFNDSRIFRLFFRDILSIRALESAFADDASVDKDDSVLILSTCLIGNKYKRFLVCAELAYAKPN